MQKLQEKYTMYAGIWVASACTPMSRGSALKNWNPKKWRTVKERKKQTNKLNEI